MDLFSIIFGRAEVITGASKAKNCKESFAEVRLCISPQKLSKINEKRLFETEKMTSNNFSASKS